MGTPTEVHLFGSLRESLRRPCEPLVLVDLEAPASLTDILDLLEMPQELVQLAMVNHRAVAKDAIVRPGDRLSLFPREYPVFADWRGYRFPDHRPVAELRRAALSKRPRE